MKKIVKVTLAVVIIVTMGLLLVQCGGQEQKPAEPTQPAESTAAATEETEVPIPTETEDDEEKEDNEDIFTPSVVQKGAPAISGKLVIWDMVDEVIDLEGDKDEVVCEVSGEKLEIVPFADRLKVSEEVKAALEDAYTEITEAGDLTELSEAVAEAIEAAEVDVEKLVVRDLVDITLDEEYNAVLEEEDKYIVLTFTLDLEEDQPLVVLYRDAEDGWKVAEPMLFHDNGTVSVAFPELCPVAFVVEN